MANNNASSPNGDDGQTLADELGIEDLSAPLLGGRGRLFSIAGKSSPVGEFTKDQLVMRPPQKPFHESGPSEVITKHADGNGILLDELGNQKKIPGAKYNGHQVYWLGETQPDTLKHLVGWFDEQNNVHKLYVQNEIVTTSIAFKLRNKTHDGELAIFPDLKSD